MNDSPIRESMGKREAEFFDACMNDNSLCDLIELAAAPAADPTDRAQWCLTATQWRYVVLAAATAKAQDLESRANGGAA